MKRKALLLLSIVFICAGAIAQDLAVDSLHVQTKYSGSWEYIENDTIQTNDSLIVEIKLTNIGSGLFNPGDSIKFGMSAGGVAIGSDFNVAVTKNLVPSRSEILEIKNGFTFPAELGAVDVCVYVLDSKHGIGGNRSDDTVCANYNIWDRAITVLSYSPTEGKAGDDVTIKGSYFGKTSADNVVKIGGQTADIKSATENQIVATISVLAVTGKVTVEAAGLIGSSSDDFTVLDENGNVIYPTSIAETAKLTSFTGVIDGQLVLSTSSVSQNVRIIDLTGKTVKEINDIPTNSDYSINLNELQDGIYIATYGDEFFKFIK